MISTVQLIDVSIVLHLWTILIEIPKDLIKWSHKIN